MFRSGYAALRGELLQERQGEQGRIGRLHKSGQEEHKPERRGRCYYGRLKGLSVYRSEKLNILSSVYYKEINNYKILVITASQALKK